VSGGEEGHIGMDRGITVNTDRKIVDVEAFPDDYPPLPSKPNIFKPSTEPTIMRNVGSLTPEQSAAIKKENVLEGQVVEQAVGGEALKAASGGDKPEGPEPIEVHKSGESNVAEQDFSKSWARRAQEKGLTLLEGAKGKYEVYSTWRD
jgi:hypothetical protein